ncbi:hypothetical protein COCHEDRAFT_23665 [Bipolaris maydis C5]|uniref:CCHC-type domain-containing protein n=1 Tax=Cochliobolus heterostrophus (strain C5 / ATCC 48332 / race O) TaxID=701091 RepID=M2TJF4_COCH5|nr:hypothetical protein COCHEDRAFT_23665 [Bipolaris maydis C5]
MNQGKGPSKPHHKKNKDDKKKINCYACSKEGHIARNYLSKNKAYNNNKTLLDKYNTLWHLRSDIDFYQIETTQRLPTYTHITANITSTSTTQGTETTRVYHRPRVRMTTAQLTTQTREELDGAHSTLKACLSANGYANARSMQWQKTTTDIDKKSLF